MQNTNKSLAPTVSGMVLTKHNLQYIYTLTYGQRVPQPYNPSPICPNCRELTTLFK